MKRTTNDRIGRAIQFENGNINVKFDLSGIYKNESDVINLLWLLESLDIDFIGEQYCLSNYDMGITLYSYYTDQCFVVSFSELAACFESGKTMKLYAHTPDEYDREEIEKRFED